jgi:hypothetical protein
VNSYPIKCAKCGAEHDRKAWQKLAQIGVYLECLEARRCPCGETLTVEVDGFHGANDHFGATMNCLEVSR